MTFADIAALRTHRDALLEESDKWFLADFPLTVMRNPEMEIIWKLYRTQLRNWPATETDLANATVPIKPPH
jgi:hypothetical protein